jgi:hypothetical protein
VWCCRRIISLQNGAVYTDTLAPSHCCPTHLSTPLHYTYINPHAGADVDKAITLMRVREANTREALSAARIEGANKRKNKREREYGGGERGDFLTPDESESGENDNLLRVSAHLLYGGARRCVHVGQYKSFALADGRTARELRSGIWQWDDWQVATSHSKLLNGFVGDSRRRHGWGRFEGTASNGRHVVVDGEFDGEFRSGMVDWGDGNMMEVHGGQLAEWGSDGSLYEGQYKLVPLCELFPEKLVKLSVSEVANTKTDSPFLENGGSGLFERSREDNPELDEFGRER